VPFSLFPLLLLFYAFYSLFWVFCTKKWREYLHQRFS
jgi:hypothetical protein